MPLTRPDFSANIHLTGRTAAMHRTKWLTTLLSINYALFAKVVLNNVPGINKIALYNVREILINIKHN